MKIRKGFSVSFKKKWIKAVRASTALCLLLLLLAEYSSFPHVAETNNASPSTISPAGETGAGADADDPFQGTRFKEYFKAGRYFEALKELDPLVVKDPKNPLYLRYYGIALDRLERYQNALQAFRVALNNSPDNAAVLYFVALTYFHMGEKERGRSVFERVVEIDKEGFYGRRAAEELKQLGPGYVRFPTSLAYGYEYDTNVRIRSRESDLPVDQSAGRHRLDFRTGYIFTRSQSRMVGVTAQSYQTLIDDDLDNFNLTSAVLSEYGIFGKNVGRFPVILTVRHTLTPTFLSHHLFTLSNSFYSELRSDLTRRVRLSLSNEFGWVNYNGDGSTPAVLSRDQFNMQAAERLTFFLDRKRKHNVYGDFSFGKANTRGSLYDAQSFGAETGLGFTLPYELILNAAFSYKYEYFPHYSLSPTREDDTYGFSFSLSRKLTERISIVGYYRLIDVDSGNDAFEYERMIGGFRLTWNYS